MESFLEDESSCAEFYSRAITEGSHGSFDAGEKAYKQDQQCIICGLKFKRFSNRKALNAKHYCKFCFRGVWAKCSPNKQYQPDKKKQKRQCTNCLELEIQKEVRDELKGQVRVHRLSVTSLDTEFKETCTKLRTQSLQAQQLKAQYQDLQSGSEPRTSELHDQIDELMHKQGKYLKKQNILTSEIQLLKSDIEVLENRKNELQSNRSSDTVEKSSVGRKLTDRQRRLSTVQDVNINLKVTIDRMKSSVHDWDSTMPIADKYDKKNKHRGCVLL